jgi:probable dihydroxyacetone kinase regulator
MSEITKRALSASLKKLLGTRPLSKITVSDITEDCGVNRQTFYYHFQDIADLIEWTCLEDCDKVLQDNKHYDSWQQGFLDVFKLMKADERFVMNIYHSVSRDQLELYLYKLTYPLLKNVVDELSVNMHVREDDKAFIAHFYKYAFVGLVLDWIGHGMVEDPQLIIDRISLLTKGTIIQALENYRVDKTI